MAKKVRTSDGNVSHARSGGYGCPTYQQRFFGHISSNSLRLHKERACNLSLKKEMVVVIHCQLVLIVDESMKKNVEQTNACFG